MTNPVIKLSEYQPPAWLISQVELTFVINENRTEVQAQLHLKKNGDSQQVELDGEGLETLEVRIDDQEVDYQIIDNRLHVTAPSDEFVLHTRVAIVPEENTFLEGLYKSQDMYCTQCEAEGFRRITWFIDRPDVLATWSVKIDAPVALSTLLSNGNKVSEQTQAGRRLVEWKDPHPKPCYLFALVAGNLVCRPDVFETQSGKLVDIKVYTRSSDATKVDFAIESIKAAMRWDESRFGREYDLDVFNVVAVSDFNMGAMENKGLNIFNTSCVLATPDVATDAAYERVEAIIGHEYFHNWSGNRVTCRDWFQLSLKEGFTVYRDAEFTSDLHSRAVKRIQDVSFLRTHQFAEDAGPTRHPVRPSEYEEISNFYTVTVYEKGAEVVGMLATLLGDKFRAACDQYFDTFDGQAVTCDDFVNCMQAHSDWDLSQFKRWYEYAGTPKVKVTTTQTDQGLQATFTQSLEGCDEPLMIPLRVRPYDDQGQPTGEAQLVVLESFEAQVEFAAPCSLLSVNEGFSAPILLEYDLSDEQLLLMAEQCEDPFNRWDAVQTFVKQLWLDAYHNDDWSGLELVAGVLDKSLNRGFKDPAFTAELLSLPDSAQIMGLIDEAVDPLKLDQVGKQLHRYLGEKLSVHIHPLMAHLGAAPLYEPGGKQAGRRRLWQVLVGYLAAAADSAAGDMISRRFVGANNLTDRMASMHAAAKGAQTVQYLDSMLQVFFQDWKDEPLLLDQWFQVQACYGSLTDIQGLLKHPEYSLNNPNRARSVLGPWARMNAEAFHGEGGYEAFVEVIGQIESINPQIAARLVLPLTQLARWTDPYQSKAHSSLLALQGQCTSKDMAEILGKALDSVK
jgi:aminopeptidase N